jgi:hypothetical protein
MVKESAKSNKLTRSYRSVNLHKYDAHCTKPGFERKSNQEQKIIPSSNKFVHIYLVMEQAPCANCQSIRFLSLVGPTNSIVLPTFEPVEFTSDYSNLVSRWVGRVNSNSSIVINLFVVKKLVLVGFALKYRISFWTKPVDITNCFDKLLDLLKLQVDTKLIEFKPSSASISGLDSDGLEDLFDKLVLK